MIIVETQQPESSDAASTNTLVTDELQRLPCRLVKLIYFSLIFSLLSFIFVLVACVPDNPNFTVATILAFLFTLPHHGASLLLLWLQRHQTESIFPFTPLSPRGIAYSVFLILTWIASTTLCAISLNNTTKLSFTYCVPINANTGYCKGISVGFDTYWPSLFSTLLSALELMIMTAIAVTCWLHRPTKTRSPSNNPQSPPSVITPEPKILSA